MRDSWTNGNGSRVREGDGCSLFNAFLFLDAKKTYEKVRSTGLLTRKMTVGNGACHFAKNWGWNNFLAMFTFLVDRDS